MLKPAWENFFPLAFLSNSIKIKSVDVANVLFFFFIFNFSNSLKSSSSSSSETNNKNEMKRSSSVLFVVKHLSFWDDRFLSLKNE